MFRLRTCLTGAIAIALVICLPAVRSAGQTDSSLKERLTRVEAAIEKLPRVPAEKRKDEIKSLNRQLKEISKAKPAGPEALHLAYLEARLLENSSVQPLDNTNYTAAGRYRKLIARGGPGALDGNPPGGRWPDPYIEKAYRNYLALTEKIDKANRTKTVYKVVDYLVKVTGSNENYSYWLAIVIITVVIKLLTTPLSHLQFESMRNLQRIQPKLEKLKRELGDDPREFQRQQWQLMKDHNASPHWGCLALLVQMPFLLLIYQTIRAYEFQFARGDFLWIGSRLAEKFDFIAPSLADPDWPLLLLYGFSMYLSTRMSTPAVDRQQAEQQKMMSILMPAMFVLIFNYFPSAFILYWLVLNVLTTTQQYFMLQKPVPALALEDDEEDLAPAPVVAAASRGPSSRRRK